MDILPTVAGLAGAALPDKPLDGIDIWPLLSGQQTDLNREVFLYFNDVALQCGRLGPWKLHVTRFNVPPFTPDPVVGRMNLPLPHPELYNVLTDPSESYDRAPNNQDIVADIRGRMDRLVRTFPQDIIDMWDGTLRVPVEDTPPDALPVRKAAG
jgi:arylsulfatase A-like enzyme